MDHLKEYRSFINSYYLAEGVRVTAGVVLPALVFNHFNLLPEGLVVSLGAMSASLPDNPGPVHHRRNGMLVSVVINTVMAMLTGFAAPHAVLLGVLICVACFIFSMIGVYGTRANSVGVAALLVMVLSMNRHNEGWDVVINAGYILAGGAWYILLSMLLFSFRPYKLAQQALGECIMSTAAYLRARAAFYGSGAVYEDIYRKVLEAQVDVQEKQALARELLFKSRHITKESTTTGRTLVMIFTDVADLFERAMTSYHDYQLLHETFDADGMMERCRQMLVRISDELDEIGIAVKSGDPSDDTGELATAMAETHAYFDALRKRKRTAVNVDVFIGMRQVLNSIADIVARIQTLHTLTAYDKALSRKMRKRVEYDRFIAHQSYDPALLKDNLAFSSNTFRHSLRISIATLVGYVASFFFPVGHSYWILLTLVVIMKPAYGLTKKRNYQRLAGTVLGAAVGFTILYFIPDNDVLFVLMVLLMIATYSLIRINYLVSVLFMTPYVLLLLHLLSNTGFTAIISDRVIDTAIGSVIAFLANLLLLPAWEHEGINGFMTAAIETNTVYFRNVSAAFTGKPVSNTEYKLSRRNAFVAQANLSDAFSRMLAEPKRKQKHVVQLHQFVVLNNELTSHIAALATYVPPLAEKYVSADFAEVIDDAVAALDGSLAIVEGRPVQEDGETDDAPYIIQQRLEQLLEVRRTELRNRVFESDAQRALTEFKPLADQFLFIRTVAKDTKKAAEKWKRA